MVAAANLVEVAALVGHTTRATILAALMSGQALTSSELAALARISRPTASGHLTKLVKARLLAVTKKRRHSYYRIASPLVARMLESIKAVAAIEVPGRYQPRSAQDQQLRFARTCYDHLAGQLGVAIADALVAKGHVVLTEEGGEMTATGAKFFAEFGAELSGASQASGFSVARAWTGASAGIMSQVSWGRQSGVAASNSAGSSGSATHVSCASRLRDTLACAGRLASASTILRGLPMADFLGLM